LGIPVAAIVDTNTDPDIVDFPIPANDDAVGSIKLIVSYIIDAWIEGRKEGIRIREEEVKKTAVEAEKAKIKAEKEAARAAAASAKGSGEPKKKAEKEAKTKTKSKKS